MEIARRMDGIAPFRVMQILAQARAMEAQGRDVVHMEIGEPDFVSPQPVLQAGKAALDAGRTHYTEAAGMPALREAIASYYAERFGIAVAPARIIVTPGASGALQLVLGTLVNPGDPVLVTDPGYPCNRHMVEMFGGQVRDIPVRAADGYQVTGPALAEQLRHGARLLMLASPANPTGNRVDNTTLRRLNDQLHSHDAILLCDEIYQGLEYAVEPATALQLDADNIVVINSFSKYFGMTGWRLGWVVAPSWMVEPMERLAQNIFLAASTVAQHAAIAALGDAARAILETRRQTFQQRRDFLYTALAELGLGLAERPPGAFYIYADVGNFCDDSQRFAAELLGQGGVAVTPGADFGEHLAARHVRFAYTTGIDRLETGVERLRTFLRAGSG